MAGQAIVVLGQEPDRQNWQFPAHVHAAVREAAARYRAGPSGSLVVTSGDRSLEIVRRGLPQPWRECDALAAALQRAGVPERAVVREGRSRDVISNLFYVKTDVLLPRGITEVVLPLAHWRIPRVAMVAGRILGPGYRLSYVGLPDAGAAPPDEASKFQRQWAFLSAITPGGHAQLAGAFYSAPYYRALLEQSQTQATGVQTGLHRVVDDDG